MDSIIRLYSGVPLDIGYQNVHNLSVADFLNQLENYKISEGSNFSYVSDNYTLRYPQAITNIINTNYIAFQNPSYKNKWFFGFVNNVKYISDITTEINFTIDYWSTYFNDLTILRSFVEREIVADDTIGLNTVDENLDIGRIDCIETIKDAGLGEYFYIGMFTNYDPAADATTGQNFIIKNRLVYGQGLIFFRISSLSDFADVSAFIDIINGSQYATVDDIKDIFIIPYSALNVADLSDHNFGDQDQYTYYTSSASLDPKTYETEILKPYEVAGRYQPVNNKCYCYPYNFLQITNNCGNIKNYKYEEFSTATVKILIEIAISIGMSIRAVPENYEGELRNYNEQLPLGKYPTCSWSADSYTNWLTQNAVNLEQKILNNGMNIVNKLSKPETTPEGLFSLSNVALDLIGDFKQAHMLPDSVHGTNNGDINWSSTYNTFCYKKMRCTDEYMRIVDGYFLRFGYKINRTKLPDLSSRPYWNYIKIGGDQFAIGSIPQDALAMINNVANKGVTIWHNIANIGNYSLDNRIV